ncbi:MAG: DUF2057 domain-containing protein [Candidatus Thiodiazotropha sp. 'RUGA']|nr:DUF2057 domain-containing protein [Candidatus Thiodiazotropha sp. 'RUGA']
MAKLYAKLLISGVLLVWLSLTGCSVQAARMTIPDSFEFLALDGQAVAGSLLSHQAQLELPEGEREITLRYKDVIIDPDLGYEAVINSRPFMISLNVKSGVHYRLVPEPAAFQDKQAFAKNPQVTISSELEPSPKPVETAAVNTTPPKEPLAVSTKVQADKLPKDAGERLRYWWLKADQDTRQSFMSWIVSH